MKLLIQTYDTKPDIPQKGKSSFHGRTPLHWASRNGHLSIVQYLIESHHVNINATTSDGTTAFCWACWQGHFSIIRYVTMRHILLYFILSYLILSNFDES